MKTKQLSYSCFALVSLAMAGLVAGCASAPTTTNPSSTVSDVSTDVEPSSPEEAAAIISEIQQEPVWVQLLNANEAISAQKGMGIRVGEKVRTQGVALTQIDFKNGVGLRIGGDSVINLQANNRFDLSAGELITWVEPSRKVPVEIITPGAIAKTQGTTVSVRILKNREQEQEIEFLAWEGPVSLQLPNEAGEVLLNAGEVVRIKANEVDISQVRQQVRRLSYLEWDQRRFRDRLLNSFGKPLPTLQAIEKAAPPTVKLLSSSTVSQIEPPTRQEARINRPPRPLLKESSSVAIASLPTFKPTAQPSPKAASTSRSVRPQTKLPNPPMGNTIPTFSSTQPTFSGTTNTSSPVRPWTSLPNSPTGNSLPAFPQTQPTPSEAGSPTPSIRLGTGGSNPSVDNTVPTPSQTQEATPQEASTTPPVRSRTRLSSPDAGNTVPTPSQTQEATPQEASTTPPLRSRTRLSNPDAGNTVPTPSQTQETQDATPEEPSTSRPTPQGIENDTEDNTNIQVRQRERVVSPEVESNTPTPSRTRRRSEGEVSSEVTNTNRRMRRLMRQDESASPNSRQIDNNQTDGDDDE